ncbi:MAG: TMEM175 family protein [Candidatus Atribacteria bacterium]|nr:TMEM175 family protein [Candidatus Atribacteria bacterium]
MGEKQSDQHNKMVLTSDRIQSLTDGIFAFAMTLLVINIDLPKAPDKLDPQLLGKYLLSLRPDFIHYVLSFILLALFWIDHHQQFYYIKKINRKILWINIFNLLFVALFPFSTSLMGDYSSQPVAAVFFISNLLVIGLFLFWNWSCVTSCPDFLDPNLDNDVIIREKKNRLYFILISLVCLVLAFIVPEWSTIPYVLSFFRYSNFRQKTRNSGNKLPRRKRRGIQPGEI